MNFEKYIGIPYAEKGRDETGADCWGLVRLIYKNELNIDLPSFSAEYDTSDNERLEELFAQYKEGWESIDTPSIGDVVIFKIFGYESHIGFCIGNNQFLHIREGRDSVIESLDNAKWSKRITGFFKYSEKSNAVLNTIPHPLKTQLYTIGIVPGTTVTELVKNINKQYDVAAELKSRINVIINGRVIAQEEWSSTVINKSDVIEYRAVAGKDVFRAIALVALIYYAPTLALEMLGTNAGAYAASAIGQGVFLAAAQAGVMLVGSSLINAIAPIRPPVLGSQGNDPDSAKRQLMVTGGSNRVNPYGAIPVVLGKVRMTPLLGSTNFLTYENERDSYLSMLLVWGYGPLSIDESTFKIGEIPISNFTDKIWSTANRITELTPENNTYFNSIYGKDITQDPNTPIELVCEGSPLNEVPPGPWFESITTEVATSVNLAFHFPQGLRSIKTKGEGAGDSYAVYVSFRIEISYDNGFNWQLLDNFGFGAVPKKDAFTFNRTYNLQNQPPGQPPSIIVRVRRTSGDNTEDIPEYKYYLQSILQAVTFSNNNNPAVDPVGSKIAKTAFKIKATDQLSGRIQGVSAIVQTYCKTWNGSAWVDGVTSNPAALMRYILEHPANPKKITNANTQINLTQLQHFYNYCAARGFEYNDVLGESKGVLEVIRDICAAGRASPALIDGKWTVIIDEPRVTITGQPLVIQHFTPHNSTGFEGSKALPKRPDGLRITYYDQDQNYQEAEIIIYDVDKNTTNASLFESITLPGVTKKSLVIDHAKWHMAQMKLRPEIYTLTSDIEYLVCNRGDRVKVMHDVPMWGLGSGRIKNRISSTKLELDEDVPMEAGVTYTMRFRSKLGGSVTRNLVAKIADGNYTEVDLLTSVTTDEADVLDLFLFGELNQESQDLIVLSIEPSTNNSARLTLVDYGVTSTYNIFTDYLNLSASTVFESQITLPPVLQVEGFGEKIPLITGFVSDESVMERVSKGIFKYNINVAYFNASQLPDITESVEVQYDLASATIGVNSKSLFVQFQNGSANITDVKEGETYKVRMRYIGRNGKVGNWSAYSNHTVVGKINPPSEVTGFTISADKASGQLLLTWKQNPELDTYTYEIRTQNTAWGTNDSNRVFFGDITRTFVKYNGSSSLTFFIRAVDSSGNYSLLSTSETFQMLSVPNVEDMFFTYANSKTTGSSVIISWSEVVTSEFAIDYYEISYNSVVKKVKANTLTIPVDWIGERQFTVKAVDIYNKKSSGYSEIITKELPSSVTGFTVSADKSSAQLLLSWNPNSEPDIGFYEVRKQDTGWGTDDINRVFYGDTTKVFVPYKLDNFYIKAISTFGNYSLNSTVVNFTPSAVVSPTGLSFSYDNTSTNASIILKWDNVTSSQFDVSYYEIAYDSFVKIINADNISLVADWVGNKIFSVTTVDLMGNKSSPTIITINKLSPTQPTTYSTVVNQGVLNINWVTSSTTSLPVINYEVRNDLLWGNAGEIFKGSAFNCSVPKDSLQLGLNNFYIKSIDTSGAYSTEALTVPYTLLAPDNPTSTSYSFADTSLTSATVTLDWSDVVPLFGLDEYEITYDSTIKRLKASTITLPADWIGEKTFTIKTIDLLGNKSSGVILSVTKFIPDHPTNFRTQVIDNTVMFYWTSPGKTSLPIDHSLLKRGATWNTATIIGEKKGDFTTVNETQAGNYTYWIASVDTDGNESIPVSISAAVSEPPDFIFHGNFVSNLNATKSSAFLQNDDLGLLIPVNTTETWAQHFTNNSWTSPSQQVSSGFPIYIQPTSSVGYYEEVFDFGSTLSSSKVTLTYSGTIISGSPVIIPKISISSDNITYLDYEGAFDIYGTNFRYVKIRITVNAPTSVALYNLNSLSVKLDAKQKTDSYTVYALDTNTNGTIVNFAKEFIDVQSITVSPMGSTPITAVYDFKDVNAAVTYSVTSNVCTVTYASHGFITGQNVRIQPSTGSGILGTYTITSHTTDTFTVNMTVANTSGNSLLYPESFRVYLFNSSGSLVTGTASWSVRGY